MIKKIEDYIVLECASIPDLKEMVLWKIKDDYVSLGGVSVGGSSVFYYVQAMVKYSK